MATAGKPRINCKYRNGSGQQHPLEALPGSACCRFHQQQNQERPE